MTIEKIVKLKFKSLSARDKQSIQTVTRYPVHGFRYEFAVDRLGYITFSSPGTTSFARFNFPERHPCNLQVTERYLAHLAMFAVIRLIKKGNLDMLQRNIHISICDQAMNGATLNIWEVIEENCGYTLENLKEVAGGWPK